MTDIPKGSPAERALDAQRDRQGLWERLFGSRDETTGRFTCGPGRTGSCFEIERGRER